MCVQCLSTQRIIPDMKPPLKGKYNGRLPWESHGLSACNSAAITDTRFWGGQTTLNSFFSLIPFPFFWVEEQNTFSSVLSSPLIRTNSQSAPKTKQKSSQRTAKNIKSASFSKSRHKDTILARVLIFRGKIEASELWVQYIQIFRLNMANVISLFWWKSLRRRHLEVLTRKSKQDVETAFVPYLLRDLVKVDEFEMLYAEFCFGTRAIIDPSVTWEQWETQHYCKKTQS